LADGWLGLPLAWQEYIALVKDNRIGNEYFNITFFEWDEKIMPLKIC
jgi:hypothetical protein